MAKIEFEQINDRRVVVRLEGREVVVKRIEVGLELDCRELPENSPGRILLEEIGMDIADKLFRLDDLIEDKEMWTPVGEDEADELYDAIC